jgi:hypothetical protein
MPGCSQLAKMLHNRLPMTAKELRQLLGELFEERVIADEKALIQKADGQLDVALLKLTAIRNGMDGLAEPESAIP